jgi:hypothetical protein
MKYRLAFLAFCAAMSVAAVAAPRREPDVVVAAVAAAIGILTLVAQGRGSAHAPRPGMAPHARGIGAATGRNTGAAAC